MPKAAPIELNLYDPETNEVVKTCTRGFLPWKMLKKAIRLQKQLGEKPAEEYDEGEMDAIANYVIELFGHDLTIEQLDEQADTAEMIAVMQSVVARARGVMDPTLPPAAK